MGVHDEAVGMLDALDHPTELGAQQGGTRVGGVHMEPDTLTRAYLTDLPQGVDGGGAGGPDGGHHDGREPALCLVLFDGPLQLPGYYSELPVHRYLP